MIFRSLYPFYFSRYPMKKHSILCSCTYFLLSSGIRAQPVDPKTLKLDTFGLCPKYARKEFFLSQRSEVPCAECRCKLPNPPTIEEHATMASTLRANIPMNICIDKNRNTEKKMHWSRKYTYTIIFHTQRKQHTFIQAFNMFTILINSKMIAGVK